MRVIQNQIHIRLSIIFLARSLPADPQVAFVLARRAYTGGHDLESCVSRSKFADNENMGTAKAFRRPAGEDRQDANTAFHAHE
jgi:hypothetical protein